MYTENYLIERLTELYKSDPYIHINISLARPHVELSDLRVKIVGVYSHIFQIEEEKNGKVERYTWQYGDVIVGIVRISEIENKKTI